MPLHWKPDKRSPDPLEREISEICSEEKISELYPNARRGEVETMEYQHYNSPESDSDSVAEVGDSFVLQTPGLKTPPRLQGTGARHKQWQTPHKKTKDKYR